MMRLHSVRFYGSLSVTALSVLDSPEVGTSDYSARVNGDSLGFLGVAAFLFVFFLGSKFPFGRSLASRTLMAAGEGFITRRDQPLLRGRHFMLSPQRDWPFGVGIQGKLHGRRINAALDSLK